MLSDAYIEVTCDGCHAVEVVPLTANGDEHRCDECTEINRYQPS